MTKENAHGDEFCSSQQQLLSALKEALRRRPADEDKVARVLGTYVSDLADRIGFSVSTQGFSGLTGGDGGIGYINNLYAEAYGAGAARFSMGGTSSLILACGVFLKRLNPERRVLICDTAHHKSVVGAQILSGLDVIHLPNPICEDTGMPGPVRRDDLLDCVHTHKADLSGTLLTSPTYEGFGTDQKGAFQEIDQAGALCIIDNAWGALMGLHPAFPQGLNQQAHVLITSPHKVGLAACQTGLALFRNPELADVFDEIMELGFGTTSPNRLLQLIAETRLEEYLSGAWATPLQRAVDIALEVRHSVSSIHPELRVISPEQVGADFQIPNHLYIDCSRTNVDGNAWAENLSTQHHIDVEMHQQNGLLLLIGAGALDAEDMFAALEASFYASRNSRSLHVLPPEEHLDQNLQSTPSCISDAYFSASELCNLPSAVGKRALVPVTLYPPGRPVLRILDSVSKSAVSLIHASLQQGIQVTGLSPDGRLRVALSEPMDKCNQPFYRTKVGTGCLVEVYDPRHLPVDVIQFYPDFFRHMFIHWPFNEFAYSLADPKTTLGPTEHFKSTATKKTDLYDLSRLDKATLPAGFARVMDAEITTKVIAERCKDEGYLSILREQGSGDIYGLVHFRIASLERLFEWEEWSDMRLFSATRSASTLAAPDSFYDKAKHHFGLSDSDRAVTVSTVAVHPKYRGRSRLFLEMMSATAKCISREHRNLPFLAEIPAQGPAREIDIATNDRLIYNLVENGRDVVYCASLSSGLKHYRDFSSFRSALAKRRSERNRVFTPSISDSLKVETGPLGDKGQGVFATEFITKGERLARFEGESYLSETAMALPIKMVNHAIQIGPNEYVHGEGGLAELYNHSCSPNAAIRNLVELYAIRDIAPGEEVVWDYRFSENSNWRMENCLCGSIECTGLVGSFDMLPEETQDFYLSQGWVSEWIVEQKLAKKV